MAFTTQSEFFNVPLINETIENECRNNTVKVQTYESAADLNFWAISEKHQSLLLRKIKSRNPTLGLDIETAVGKESKNIDKKRKQKGERCRSIGPYETQRRSCEKEKKTGFKRCMSSRSGRSEYEKSNIQKEGSRKNNPMEDNENNGFLSFRSLKSGNERESLRDHNSVTEIHYNGVENSDILNLNLSELNENSGQNNKNNQSPDKWNSDTDIETDDDSKITQNKGNLIFGKEEKITDVDNSQLLNEDSCAKSRISGCNTLGEHTRELGGFTAKFPCENKEVMIDHGSQSSQPTSSSVKCNFQPGSNPCSSPSPCGLERLCSRGCTCQKKQCSKKGRDNIHKNTTLQNDTGLIRIANITMENLEKILQEKSYLEEQLYHSNQCLTESVTECDELRKRLKSFKEMEAKITHLQAKAKNAGHVTGDIKENLFRQAKYIEKMEEELVKTHNYYEEKIKALMCNEEALHRHSCSLKEELVRTRCEAMKVEPLQKEISQLCYEIKTLQEALSEYDCQYKQLIQVVEELQSSNASTESSDFIEDLAYFTSTTLLEIKKEMENRNVLGMANSKVSIEKQSLEQQSMYIEELKEEKNKLETTLINIQKDCENICTESIEKLKHLQNENEELRQFTKEILEKNKNIDKMFEIHRQSVHDLEKKVGHLGKELETTSNTAFQMSQTIEKSEELVKEIVKVRQENEKLERTIDLIQKADSSHEIEDLKRKLEEALNNLEKCKQENNMLKENLKSTTKEPVEISSNRKQGHCLVRNSGNVSLRSCSPKETTELQVTYNINCKRSQSEVQELGHESVRNDYDIVCENEEKLLSSVKIESAKKVCIDVVGEDMIGKTERSGKQLPLNRKEKDCRNLNLVKNAGAYDEFVTQNASKMKSKVNFGSSFVRELRAILDAFISECGFCFCRDCIPKSRFYATCHKILHRGIQSVTFNDLVYMHKKLFKAIEKIQPGWLLQSMLSEQLGPDGLKCCNCKNILCCTNSEEMLKEKVTKLERDIEMAREYLENLKACPSNTHSVNGHLHDGQEMAPMKRNSSYSLKSRFTKPY